MAGATATKDEKELRPDSNGFCMDGSELADYRGFDQVLVLPENTETIRRDALSAPYRPLRHKRREVIFPPALKELTWEQAILLHHDHDLTLPEGFLRRECGDTKADAQQPLKGTWILWNVTLGTAARAYLSQEPRIAATAEGLLRDEDIVDAARLMIFLLEERGKKSGAKTALRRAVSFFVRHGDKIPIEVAEQLSLLVLNNRRASGLAHVGIPGRQVVQLAQLNYLLTVAGIAPDNPLFSRVRTDKGGLMTPEEVKYAIAPYIAESLNPAIYDGADDSLHWVRHLTGPEIAGMNSYGQLQALVERILPGGRPTPLLAPLLGRYGLIPQVRAMLVDRYPDAQSAIANNEADFQRLEGSIVLMKSPFAAVAVKGIDRAAVYGRFLDAALEMDEWRFVADTAENRSMRQVVLPMMDDNAVAEAVVIKADGSAHWKFADSSHLGTSKDVIRHAVRTGSGDHTRAQFTVDTGNFWEYLAHQFSHELTVQYLEGSARSAVSLRRIAKDPFFRLLARGVVWEQDGKTMTMGLDGPVDASGVPVEISDAPARMAHVLQMSGEEVDAWVRYFDGVPYDSWMGQMEEPDYGKVDIAADRFEGAPFTTSSLKRKKMMQEVLWTSDGRLSIQRSTFSAMYQHWSDLWSIHDVEVEGSDLRSNRILYQLDTITMDARIKKDDTTLLPLLERAPLKTVRQAQKKAQGANATHLKAGLMQILQIRDSGKAQKNRFSTSL